MIPLGMRDLIPGEEVIEGDYWSVTGKQWTKVGCCHIGDKQGAWPHIKYRRRVATIANETNETTKDTTEKRTA